jgi:hypothetical protein
MKNQREFICEIKNYISVTSNYLKCFSRFCDISTLSTFPNLQLIVMPFLILNKYIFVPHFLFVMFYSFSLERMPIIVKATRTHPCSNHPWQWFWLAGHRWHANSLLTKKLGKQVPASALKRCLVATEDKCLFQYSRCTILQICLALKLTLCIEDCKLMRVGGTRNIQKYFKGKHIHKQNKGAHIFRYPNIASWLASLNFV